MGKQTKPPRDETRDNDEGNDVEGHGQGILSGLPGTGGDALLPGQPGTGGDSIHRPIGSGELRTDDEDEGQPPLT